MRILAIDTSAALLSAAVLDGKTVAASFEITAERGHSAEWASAVGKVLDQARLKPSELDLIAVGTGPGSFTGLRVGLAAAKTMAWSLRTKLIGVCSMEALARAVPPPEGGRVAVVLDARRGDVYAALYEVRGGLWRARVKPAIVRPEGFAAAIDRYALAVGAGAELYRQALTQASSGKLDVAPRAATYAAKAEYVARAAAEHAALGRFDDPGTLEPLYLHPKDCNVTYPRKT